MWGCLIDTDAPPRKRLGLGRSGELGPTRRSTALPRSSPRPVRMWPRRVRLGYHIHDHRRVGATGMASLMEPGVTVGPPSNGQVDDWAVSSCQCINGRAAPYTCFPSQAHLPLALPWARAGSVMVSLNLESRVLAKHKMGPAFSHFGRLRRGLSFCFCRIPQCIFVPCTWRFSDPPDPGMSFAPGTYPRALAFMRRRQMTRVRDGPCRRGYPEPRGVVLWGI